MGKGTRRIGVPPLQKIVAYPRGHVPTDEERRFYASFIEQLRVRRRALGISQEELDRRLGVSDHQVAKWESFARLPGAFMMMCWANALGVVITIQRES
jgi:ribosome-binding protein aMBF1 (putative translation factor)